MVAVNLPKRLFANGIANYAFWDFRETYFAPTTRYECARIVNSRNGQFDQLVLVKIRRAQVARNSHGVNSVCGDALFGCCSISFPKQFREQPFSIFLYFVREDGSHSWINWCVGAKACVDRFFLVFQEFFEIHRIF